MTLRHLCALLLTTLTTGSAAWAHGLERHYGNAVNGSGAVAPGASSSGAPAFTLMVMETTSVAMERALVEGRNDDARERAQRLPKMVEELDRRSRSLEPAQRKRAEEAVAALSKSAARVYATAGDRNAEIVRAELVELRRLIASMQAFLRESAESSEGRRR